MKRTMTVIIYIIISGVVLGLGYIRFAPANIGSLHQSPTTAQSTGKPNSYRLDGDDAPVFKLTVDALAEKIDAFALDQPRVSRIAGSAGDYMMTYVQRSLIMGYPDYITIEVTSVDEDKSKLEIYSRSRFGHSDLGVNKRRITEWLLVLRR